MPSKFNDLYHLHRGKLNQFVEYPLTLDISSAMSDASPKGKGGAKGGREKYALFGVLVHSGGSMHSGGALYKLRMAPGSVTQPMNL